MYFQEYNLNINNKSLKNIFILSGAGLYQSSGLQTFRSDDGLWAGEDIEAVATATGFKNDPDRVYNFYNKRRREVNNHNIKPNKAHYSLVELEKKYTVNIVTQNISGLQSEAGSSSVIEIHGNINRAVDINNNHVHTWKKDLTAKDVCPICGSQMRMDIVLFEEQVYHLDKVQELAFNADLFVSIGTSNNVWPASSIIHIFKERKKPTIELNLEKTNISHLFDHSIVGKKAEESVTEFTDYMLDLHI